VPTPTIPQSITSTAPNSPTIICERNERPGDSWRKRYKSLCLHDPVWYDHLPYIKFPENWPVFSPKDKIGDWLEMYTRVMELNYWTSTTARSARYDEAAGEWVVVVERDGQEITLRPKQLVMATGMSGKPNLPEIPGMDVFRGDQHHSSQHPGPDAYRGKKAVVIGSNNSAHDICAALWEAGADVTMVQRSSTHIVKSDSLMDISDDGWRQVIDANLVSYVGCTKKAIERIRANGRDDGQIILVGSISVHIKAVGESVYNASKGGVAMFAETLRKEMIPEKIRVTLIEPGAIATHLQPFDEAKLAEFERTLEMLPAVEVAEAILFAATRPPGVDVVTLRIEPLVQKIA